MKAIFAIITLMTAVCYPQTIVFLEEVPDDFKEMYSQKVHDYNPLSVGNIWQFANSDNLDQYSIEKDTIVNSKRYFKKLDYYAKYVNGEKKFFYKWERFDSTKRASYMLDVSDEDNDGNTEEELLLDSLEIPNYEEYISFRYYWKESSDFKWGPYRTHLSDSSWAIVFGDTVMTRRVVYLDFLRTDTVADKFGVVKISEEFHNQYLSGAIINGKTYGTVVSVDESHELPNELLLAQNYPNPFNSTTNISFTLPKIGFVELKLVNTLGQITRLLLEQFLYAGSHNYQLNDNGLSTGVYFLVLRFEDQITTKKIILLK